MTQINYLNGTNDVPGKPEIDLDYLIGKLSDASSLIWDGQDNDDPYNIELGLDMLDRIIDTLRDANTSECQHHFVSDSPYDMQGRCDKCGAPEE